MARDSHFSHTSLIKETGCTVATGGHCDLSLLISDVRKILPPLPLVRIFTQPPVLDSHTFYAFPQSGFGLV